MKYTDMLRCPILLLVCAALVPAQQKYSGPRPPKPDVPYLVHAENLVETEATEASEDKSKKGDDIIYFVNGGSSPAKTPLAEPIFLVSTETLAPEKLELYRMEVKNGRREVLISKKRKKTARRYGLLVKRLDEHLYQIEVNEGLGLESGEYSLTPEGSNQVFCFSVY